MLFSRLKPAIFPLALAIAHLVKQFVKAMREADLKVGFYRISYLLTDKPERTIFLSFLQLLLHQLLSNDKYHPSQTMATDILEGWRILFSQ